MKIICTTDGIVHVFSLYLLPGDARLLSGKEVACTINSCKDPYPLSDFAILTRKDEFLRLCGPQRPITTEQLEVHSRFLTSIQKRWKDKSPMVDLLLYISRLSLRKLFRRPNSKGDRSGEGKSIQQDNTTSISFNDSQKFQLLLRHQVRHLGPHFDIFRRTQLVEV